MVTHPHFKVYVSVNQEAYPLYFVHDGAVVTVWQTFAALCDLRLYENWHPDVVIY